MAEPGDVVLRTARCLDELDFEAFLALCTTDFRYVVEVWSPDLRRDMIWFDHDRAGIEALFGSVHEHIVRPERTLRHLGQCLVDLEGADLASVDTSVAVFMTDTHGDSRLWAVGRYLDRVERHGGSWLLAQRVVRLETRNLGIGSHLPV
jgi:3-phenylpropionate/cinnamic acid dioxygenase small subunit